MAQARLNLKGVTALVVDSDNFTRGLVMQMLRGFGLTSVTPCETGAGAIEYLQHNYVDLCIVEAMLPDMPCTDFTGWLRRQEKAMRFIPVIVLTGYTQLRMVASARDGGANCVAKKPISPQALFDRITWVARSDRPFIETKKYIGPDRRFRSDVPPDGIYKRDTDDNTDVESGAAVPADNKSALAQALARGQ